MTGIRISGEKHTTEPTTRRGGRRPLRLGAREGALVVALTLVGAIVGAGLGATPQERFVAESVVAVQADNGSVDAAELHRSQWRTAADAALLPSVLQAAAAGDTGSERPSLQSLRNRVTVVGSPGTSLLRIRARDRSPAAARALAVAVAQETVFFLRQVSRSNLRVDDGVQGYSFEAGLDGWSRGASLFNLLPTRLARRPSGQTGEFSLRVDCAGPTGCGPHTRPRGPFAAAARYRAAAYVRATRPGARVRLVLGSSREDVATGAPVTLSDTRWRLLTVSWTPRANSTTAELATQTVSAGKLVMYLDGVVVGEDRSGIDQGVQSAADEASRTIRARRVAAGDRYAVLGTASSAGELDSDTVRSTLVGGLLGLALAVSALAAAELARRRQRT